MSSNFRIYLAGFDVFLKKSIEHGQTLVAQCAAKGAVGLYPLDNQCPPGLTGVTMARWIAEANEAMINSCDAVLVNLNPFRGDEPDSGSVYEFGYAHGRGKPVWGYFADHRPMIEKIAGAEGFDASGMAIEDFGLPLNLMLATRWVGASTTFEAGLEGVLAYLNELAATHETGSTKRRLPAEDELAP
jgi:nucleoside 2-deoxyribosyltransferase